MQGKLFQLATSIGCLILFALTLGSIAPFRVEAQIAPTSPISNITIAKINADYAGVSVSGVTAASTTPKVRILIVPGHQPDQGGTVFAGVFERDVVVDIADKLAALLAKNPHYDVMIARTKSAWNPTLQTYFDTHAADITSFRQAQALSMANNLASGDVKLESEQVYHNSTSADAALQLYGINKWANENNIDITLHIHINDDSGHRWNVAGQYDGFAVYVPNYQFQNATTSRVVGEAIATRLNAYHATSTLPIEDAGVVEDQSLIATGSNNSVSNAAVLIEYGYIYEPQFQIASVRSSAVADYVYQTYLGLQDFFKDPVVSTSGSRAFPYDWSSVVAKKNMRGPGVYALQAALHHLGYYPPLGKSFSDCPVSGLAGACTRSAIVAYQKSQYLTQTGTLGPKTRAALVQDLAAH